MDNSVNTYYEDFIVNKNYQEVKLMIFEEFKLRVVDELLNYMSEEFHSGYEVKIENNILENNINQEYLVVVTTDPLKPDIDSPKMDILKIYEMGYMKFNENFEDTMKNLAKTYEQAYRSAPLKESSDIETEIKDVSIIPMRNGQFLISGKDISDKILNENTALAELAIKKDKNIFVIIVDKNNYVAEPVERVSAELYDFYSLGSKDFVNKDYKDFGKLLLYKKEGEFLENRAEIIKNDINRKAKAI